MKGESGNCQVLYSRTLQEVENINQSYVNMYRLSNNKNILQHVGWQLLALKLCFVLLPIQEIYLLQYFQARDKGHLFFQTEIEAVDN